MKLMMNKAPMGWNSYDYYDTNVNEAQVKANADYMSEHLKAFGWEYVVVDIQWYAWNTATLRDRYQYIPFGKNEMDEYGRLLPCPEKFPSSVNGAGFKPLADYVHEKGLKFGIHIMRGIPREAAQNHLPILGSSVNSSHVADPSSICKWNPDMYGVRSGRCGAPDTEERPGQAYYDSILQLYTEWGVDYIKCDDICNTNMYPHDQYSAAHEIEMLAKAIEKCGRDIVLSLSPGPALIEKAWHYEKYANMWRITDDFWDNWDLLLHMFERCELWQNHVGKGSYPDCDMLPLGIVGKGFAEERRTKFTREEQRTMMTLWCIFGSPLMIGAELTKLDNWTLALLTNANVLKLLSNDYVGKQAERRKEYAVWSCYNSKTEEKYIALFNLKEEEQKMSVRMEEIEQFYGLELKETIATELWSGAEEKMVNGTLTANVAAHDAKIYRIE